MTARTFPPADACTPEDLDAIADLVVRDPSASLDLAGSRAHIEALCRRYQQLAQDLSAAQEEIADLAGSGEAAREFERLLAAETNLHDSTRTELRALQATLDHERNERQGEVLAAEADRERADSAQAIAEIFETTAKAALALISRPGTVDLAEIVRAVDGRMSRALVRERAISAALGRELERAMSQLEEIQQTRALNDQLRSITRAITGEEYETMQRCLDAELAAHPEPGPLHHARDQRDTTEDTTP